MITPNNQTVATVTVNTPSGPVTSRADQSAADRFYAISKAYGAPVEKPSLGIVPSNLHWNTNTQSFDTTEVAAAPAKPTAPAAPVHDPAKIEAFDAEMRATGMQTAQPAGDTSGRSAAGRTVADVDVAGLEAVNKAYAALSPAERQAKRSIYLSDLQSFYEGRRLGESVQAFRDRVAGAAPVQVPSEPAPTYTPQQWEVGHKDVTDTEGWIPLTRINANGLSGYVLPKLIEGQQYHKSIFAELANARAAGLSQDAVTSYITAQMKRDGWVK